jgi:hypothetical protein
MKKQTQQRRQCMFYLVLFVLWLLPSLTWIQEILTVSPEDESEHSLAWPHFYWRGFHRIVHVAYRWLLFDPVKFIYLHGPGLGGWGFWNGQDLPDICTQLSKGVPGRLWLEKPEECDLLINKQVVALCIGIWMVLFGCVCYIVVQVSMWQYYMSCQQAMLQPVLQHLQRRNEETEGDEIPFISLSKERRYMEAMATRDKLKQLRG